MSNDLMIEARGLTKRFGPTLALAGIDLEVPAGAILGVLGPNGAGKSTAVRILTTLARPDDGWARVAGHDVVAEARDVQRKIGVTAQDATVDRILSGRQNLVMVGRLSGMRRRDAEARATELLEELELTEAGDRVAGGYSGGMRRRLDLAAGLVCRPPVLFLDEPTTGLDPVSRMRMWEVIRRLVAGGVTLLLTTQYLDEADELADNIVVLDGGRVVADGTPDELKRLVPGGHIKLKFANDTALEAAARVLDESGRDDATLTLAVPTDGGIGALRAMLDSLDAADLTIEDLSIHTPDLDDVFFALTGRTDSKGTAS